MISFISLIILLPKYTFLKFHFNAVLSRAFSKTFKINQELEEYISGLFFPVFSTESKQFEEKACRLIGLRCSNLSPLTLSWFLFLASQISHLRSPTFYNEQNTAMNFDWNSNKTELFSVRTIYFYIETIAKIAIILFQLVIFIQTGGNEAV